MDKLSNIRGHLNGLIEAVKSAEKITKASLGEFSREVLPYVTASDDIDTVNRMVNVLTPVNRRTAILFFKHFLPFEQEKAEDGTHSRFGKKLQGEKRVNRKLELIDEFLADADATIWSWSDDNIEIDLKKRDLSGDVKQAVTKALTGTKASKTYEETPPLPANEVLAAVFAGGVSLDDMFSAIEMIEQKQAEDAEKAKAVMSEAEADIEAAQADLEAA